MSSLVCLAKTMITGNHPVPPTEMPCYPGMSLKKQILVGFVWADSLTSLENQPVEMQALSGFEASAGVAQKKDVKKTTSEARMSFRISTGSWDILRCC
jgi:hypothetical protein